MEATENRAAQIERIARVFSRRRHDTEIYWRAFVSEASQWMIARRPA